jgi:hypothetical protein
MTPFDPVPSRRFSVSIVIDPTGELTRAPRTR